MLHLNQATLAAVYWMKGILCVCVCECELNGWGGVWMVVTWGPGSRTPIRQSAGKDQKDDWEQEVADTEGMELDGGLLGVYWWEGTWECWLKHISMG